MLPVVRRERQIHCLGAEHKMGARKSSRVLNNALILSGPRQIRPRAQGRALM